MRIKRLLLVGAVLLLSALTLSTTATPGCAQVNGCGIEVTPIKPIPPIGCRDLARECVCDTSRQPAVCRWAWVCIPR